MISILFAAMAQDAGWIKAAQGYPIPSAGGRSLVRRDELELRLIQGQSWPDAAEELTADAEGWLNGRANRGGYVVAKIESDKVEIKLLEAQGPGLIYVNGAPRVGNAYGYDYHSLPVELRKGSNTIIFSTGRGRIRARLVDPPAGVSLDLRDATTPDLLPTDKGMMYAGIIVRNATNQWQRDLVIKAENRRRLTTNIPPIPPMTTRKVAVGFSADSGEKIQLTVEKVNTKLHEAPMTLRRRELNQPYKRTFISGIDGSVQYFAVNPSQKAAPGQALFLSLHGASVEAIGQAEAYGSKDWGHLVAPTNRRPFGFDWEDVGRLDALEVLENARKMLKTDPAQTYVTGHSMGGHGTYQMGVHFPDKFAGVAPAAAWESFWSYAGGVRFANPSPTEKMLVRASSPSDTLSLKQNYWMQRLFILHGDADTTVPLSEARNMRKALEGHPHLGWHEEKGQGHWYDTDPAPGANCVDFAPIFDMFKQTSLQAPKIIDFTTSHPGVSASAWHVSIDQAEQAFVPARVVFETETGRLQITNIRRLSIKNYPNRPTVQLDGQSFSDRGTLHLMKEGNQWKKVAPVPAIEKNPIRSGGFKDIFKNRFVLVYGTMGSRAENEWAWNKVRYDAETFWYRGNGAVDIVSDREFRAEAFRDRNVILYGHRQSNASWDQLLKTSPVQVERGKMMVSGKNYLGNDLAVLFIRPRADSKIASVAAISGTGTLGLRLTDRMPFFTAGAGMPDFVAIRTKMLTEGSSGIIGAGFFGNDWRMDSGSFAWAE